jgi:8-oxo-dGTP diphosphatase
MMARTRLAARLVVVDGGGRVLLFRHVDREGKDFWATPGGGLEPGETEEEAARREAAEELGAREVELQRLWTGHSDLLFARRRVPLIETFFLMTCASAVPGSEVQEVHRREGIVDVRWWPLEEIQQADELLFPLDLADRLREHLPRR